MSFGLPPLTDKRGPQSVASTRTDRFSKTPDDAKPTDVKSTRSASLLKLEKIIDHWSVTAIMTLVTIYALFGDDIRLLAFGKQSDNVFYTMTAVAMFLFFVELVLNSIAKPDYFNSFYFWLDFVSTVSLITDIGWIWDSIIGNTDYAASNAEQAS